MTRNTDMKECLACNSDKLELKKYEDILGREIQLFECEDKKKLSGFGSPLLTNIVRGEVVKGTFDFLKVKANV